MTKFNAHIELKTQPFLESLGRQDRVLDSSAELEGILDAPWDISATHRRMGSMANHNIQYLENALA